MPENLNITKDIDWLKEPIYRQVITKGELLKDIKTNIKSLLNDYRGRGIENEARLIAEVDKMFTGGVVPSLVDWKVLNIVLYELSEVKEQGAMYRDFIKDVSDSLGVTDLIKIRNFIEYITLLAPIQPSLSMTVDKFPLYEVYDLRATFKNDISQPHEENQATLNWKVREPSGVSYATIRIGDSPSEDVKQYVIRFRAGTFTQTYYIDAKDMNTNKTLANGIVISNRTAEIKVPIQLRNWFGNNLTNLTFHVEAAAIDKRGNEGFSRDQVIFPSSQGIPQGYHAFEVQYLPTPSRGWRKIDYLMKGNWRSSYPIDMLDADGNHQFCIIGYDKGLITQSNPLGKQTWVYSPDYNLTFRGDPPGKPQPVITDYTINRADFKWAPTENTEYYKIQYRQWHGNYQRTWNIPTSSNPSSYFGSLKEDTWYEIWVGSFNEWYPNGIWGSVWVKTRRKVNKTKVYHGLRYATYNEQSYMPNSKPGYYRPNGKTTNNWQDKAHWKNNSGTLFQGHWRETNWGPSARGYGSKDWYYQPRSTGYWASDGQSHGNNSTMIEIDYKQMRKDLRNATVNSVSISLKREGSIHGWPTAKPIYLYTHNEDWANWKHLDIYDWYMNRVSYNNNPSTSSDEFARGGYADINNWKTRWMVWNIQHGYMKGFAFIKYYSTYFHNTVHRGAVDYMRLDPSEFKVTVHYTDIE